MSRLGLFESGCIRFDACFAASGRSFKVREMAERGGALSNLESRQMLEYGIHSGRGGIMLKLTADQLARLKH